MDVLCGGAGEWMYRSVLGVAPASIGWKTIAIRPQLSTKGPAAVNGSVHTIRGAVSVAWVMVSVQERAMPSVWVLAALDTRSRESRYFR